MANTTYPYDLNKVLLQMQTSDDILSAYNTSPDALLDMLMQDNDLMNLGINTGLVYSSQRLLPLTGGLAILNSKRYRPTPTSTGLMQFNIASANGAFAIYNNTQVPTQDHFIKVGLQLADYMEIEALTLRVLQDKVPAPLQRYFLDYGAAANIIVYKDRRTGSISLNLKRYTTPDQGVNFFGNSTINIPDTVVVPTLITRVVQGGISLSMIIDAWASITPATDARRLEAFKASMRKFHKNTIYQNNALGQHQLAPRVQRAAADRIFGKWGEFLTAIITAAAPLKLSHGDLHAANVMYDEITDNFVMIDYGRATMDLQGAQVPISTILQEMKRIESKPTDLVAKQLKAPNDFYTIFDNFGARPALASDTTMSTKYGILADLAPLTLLMHRHLKARLGLPNHPIVHYDFHNDSLIIASEQDIKEYLESGSISSIVELAIVYVALIVIAAYDLDLIPNAFSIPGTDQIGIEYNRLFSSSDPMALFFGGSQPNPEHYRDYKTRLDTIVGRVKYFETLEGLLREKMIGGGEATQGLYMHNPTTNIVPTGKMVQSKRTANALTDLQQLTIENYTHNMLRSAELSIVNASKSRTPAPYAFQMPANASHASQANTASELVTKRRKLSEQ